MIQDLRLGLAFPPVAEYSQKNHDRDCADEEREDFAWVGGLSDVVLNAAENVFLSGRNLQRTHVMPYADVSTYHILWSDVVLVESNALGYELDAVAEKPRAAKAKAEGKSHRAAKAEAKSEAKAARKSAAKKTAHKAEAKAAKPKAKAAKKTAKKSASPKKKGK